MKKSALQKHEIYNKLSELDEEELGSIAEYIDSLRQKKHVEEKKIIKLEGILKGHHVDLGDLKKLKKETWNHVDRISLQGLSLKGRGNK
jgi:hypothetical protein